VLTQFRRRPRAAPTGTGPLGTGTWLGVIIDGPQHRPWSYCLDAAAIHPHGRQNSSASFHCGNGSCSWFCTMAALVGLQSRCQIDMRCEHRVWAQAGSLRTGSRPFIGRRERLAKGYTLYKHPTGRQIRPLTDKHFYVLSLLNTHTSRKHPHAPN